ncbi:MAG: hypothetical protein EWV50_01550 [Microcystis aeruginosa Ma_MB_F_20061100_S20]|nr:MAG: hypothetical protein EWV50_01550 [Microcystis aeruginosa Ma_MB_F_20061100_S20]
MWGVGCGVWGVGCGCGVWGVGCGCGEMGRINKNNLLSPVSCLLSSLLRIFSFCGFLFAGRE